MISIPKRPSYAPYPHSAMSSVNSTLSKATSSDSPPNSSSNVLRARVRGLTNTRSRWTGSISFPGPTRSLPVPRTCFSPLGVSSSSVMPVYRPFIVHSVSPSASQLELRAIAQKTGTRV
jgi:hypothetical protein